MRIEGFDMPGGNVHVGVQRGREVVDLHPGDAAGGEWSFEVRVKPVDGGLDFGGPYVHGKRGDRFVYLSWGVVEGGTFRMFRRAKLHFADAPADVLATGAVTCRVRMTDACGNPRCARVRPPDATWTTSEA